MEDDRPGFLARRLNHLSLTRGDDTADEANADRPLAHLLTNTERHRPNLLEKFLGFNWSLMALIVFASCTGFLVLYSVAGGSLDPWARAQMSRSGLCLIIIMFCAFIPVRFWKLVSVPAYLVALALVVLVDFIGVRGMGAQRWIDLGFIQLQPSELMKVGLVMALAAYYNWLDMDKTSRPLWVVLPLLLTLVPAFIIYRQPDLGTAILVAASGGIVMFVAGVSLYYFVTLGVLGCSGIAAIIFSRDTPWQVLKDYQYRRIETFLDPSSDPLGAGYHITQSKIALGSGGLTGRGLLQGSQSQLNFLPEKHTDFVFTTLAEEFGLVWSLLILGVYGAIVAYCTLFSLRSRDRYSSLLVAGLGGVFFLYFSTNIAMVTGIVPVVGVPLPFISYGGSALLVLAVSFGLIQSAYVHRNR